MCKFGILILGEVGKFCPSRFVPREWVGWPKFESHLGILLRDGCACGAHVKFGIHNFRRVRALNGHIAWYHLRLHVGDHLRSI